MCTIAIEQTDDGLQEEINKAHVVCLVYSVEDDNSLERITSHWLPLIRDCTGNMAEQRKPVVLVGNKVDLVEYSTLDVTQCRRRTIRMHPLTICFLCSLSLSNSLAARPDDNGRLSRGGKLR